MGANYFSQAGTFLIETLFWLYILLVLLRFLLQVLRADFYNPISKFLVKVTNPPLRPLRRMIPGLWGIDLASVVLLLGLEGVKLYLLYSLHGVTAKPLGILVLSVAELLYLTFGVFLFALVVRAVLSWIAPHTYNPATSLLISLSEPLLRPARRVIPPVSGLDLSFIVVFILLYLARILIVQPLMDLGRLLLS